MSKLRYLTGATSVLKWSVLYPIDPKNSRFKKLFYFLWSVFFILSFVITVIQCIVELAIKPFNLVEQNIVVMNTAIYITLFMNFAIFFHNSENLVNLVGNINRNFAYETDNGVETVSMEYSVKLSDKLPIFWTVSLIGSALLSALQPLMMGIRIMPVPGWFPYDYTKSPYYEISYFWQILCQINLGVIYAGSDMIYPCMTLIIGHQFKILASNLKNSFFYAIWKCGEPKETVLEFKNQLTDQDLLWLLERYENVFRITNSDEFRQIHVNYLKKNIQHHQLLLGYCEDLNQIMGLFLLTKVVACFFNVTFIAFSLITTGDDDKIVGLCSYVFFASSEVFVCTCGGQILTENADFLWSLYEIPWYLCDLQFQKMFIMVNMRVKKMIYTKAGNYFLMCFPMFISFMRTIFSYVALLKELVGSDRLDTY